MSRETIGQLLLGERENKEKDEGIRESPREGPGGSPLHLKLADLEWSEFDTR